MPTSLIKSRTLQYQGWWPNYMRQKNKASSKVFQFPLPLAEEDAIKDETRHYDRESGPQSEPLHGLRDMVLCGTFRKDPRGLKVTYERLKTLGFNILSPGNVSIESEEDGFVYMEGESIHSPDVIESRHLDAIQRAAFVWLHAPEGYVGTSGSLEIGFARAVGVPVYADQDVKDPVMRQFVQTLTSVDQLPDAMDMTLKNPPRPPVRAFQSYYRRAALLRGYSKEDARDTLVLMLEEMGELARAIRKSAGLARHGSYSATDEGLELADVFLYVIHLANVLKIDLGAVVQQKEIRNLRRFEEALAK